MGRTGDLWGMQRKFYSKKIATPPADAAGRPSGGAIEGQVDFWPSPDEVARRAYFTFVNQGSRPGHDVQHWLDAEAELIKERNKTRAHGFHNPT